MADYRVTWEIDIFDADSPEDAAGQALAIQRRPSSIATVFQVTGPDGATWHVDLTEPGETYQLNSPNA